MWTLIDLGDPATHPGRLAPGAVTCSPWPAPAAPTPSPTPVRLLTGAPDIGELHRLATTVERWWPNIEAFIHTGITNATSEGVNRIVKLVARNAFGFTNPANQRLRVRCATTRRIRGHLQPA
jgi:hypothetical protein